MVLTRKEILDNIREGKLKFEPMIDGFQIQPHAVDLRLGKEFYIPKQWKITKNGREVITIDPFDNHDTQNFEKVELEFGQYFELLPGEFVIAKTLEAIALTSKNLMAILFPRSSINRRGLAVDLSGIIDTGYEGCLMIPIMNNTSKQVIRIYPAERICQVIFQTLSTNLSDVEISQHGLHSAKYTKSQEGFVGGRSDKKDEIDLIRLGKLDELKTKYRVEL
jgi:dCTP deaminase